MYGFVLYYKYGGPVVVGVVVVVVSLYGDYTSLMHAVPKYDSGDEDTNGSLPWHYFRIFQYPWIMDSIHGASEPVPSRQ